jgi:hypothetical protein
MRFAVGALHVLAVSGTAAAALKPVDQLTTPNLSGHSPAMSQAPKALANSTNDFVIWCQFKVNQDDDDA